MPIIEDTDVHLFDRSQNTLQTECGFGLGGTRVRSVTGYSRNVTCNDCKRNLAERDAREAKAQQEAEDEKLRQTIRQEVERVIRENNMRIYQDEANLAMGLIKQTGIDLMQEARDGHRLLETAVVSYNTATYKCSCGQGGTAIMADHLSSYTALVKRAKKNHELHQARAYVRMLEGSA